MLNVKFKCNKVLNQIITHMVEGIGGNLSNLVTGMLVEDIEE